jgi:hypothetical protein
VIAEAAVEAEVHQEAVEHPEDVVVLEQRVAQRPSSYVYLLQ